MNHRLLPFLVICFLISSLLIAQQNDYDMSKYIKKLHKPENLEEFSTVFRFPPVNQDTTNACWSFATTSFIESEMKRLGMEPVKLSVMYPFFHAYVEKAKEFIKTEGESRFTPGDLFTGVIEIIKEYGIVPESAYRGQTRAAKTYNHIQLENELYDLMAQVKEMNIWDEELVLQKVRKILYQHLGVPPQSFEYKGKIYTPRLFLKEVVRLPWDDYIMVTSFTYAPFYEFIELKVPDNWAHYDTYFNVPLDLFYDSIKNAIKNGYSLAFDSDTGEPGRLGSEDIVFVPEFDIPSKYIDQSAREFRFNNGSTTDDHLMQIVGYKRKRGNDWFLVKDSWRTAWDGDYPGYYFFHGDYLKLKALAFLVHKDAVPEIVKKIKK
ncbi:MAG: C1 family peptidase [Calditrichaceae bacterium]